MCGPSAQEQAVAGNELNLSQALNQAYSTRFATQQSTLQNLNTQLGQLATGQTPQGFGAAELAAKNTGAINASAAATRNAQQMASDAFAGQGGGGANPSGITSGIQEAVRGGIAATEAGQLASAQNEITQQNYATGRENLEKSIAGLGTLADIQDPTKYASAASSANTSSFGMANTINQQKNQETADIVGGITGIGKSLLGGGLSVLSGIGGGGGGPISPGMQTQTPVGFDPSAGDYLNEE